MSEATSSNDQAAPAILSVDDLTVAFPSQRGPVLAARHVTLTLKPGEVLGLVGESGSGKSITCRAIIGLIPRPGEVVGGNIRLGERELTGLSAREWAAVRGRQVGIVMQESSGALDPVQKIGIQLREVLRVVGGLSQDDSQQEALRLLEEVGLPDPTSRFHAYPHELSGGMRQRVSIALALAPRPLILLADEPTTALDVTVQAQILELLRSLQAQYGMAMVLVSHDFGVIAQCAQTVAVMYAGYVVEHGPVAAIFDSPRHPYTQALLDSLIPLNTASSARTITAIPGQAPSPADVGDGCPFASRCRFVRPQCAEVDMSLIAVSASHETACPFQDDLHA